MSLFVVLAMLNNFHKDNLDSPCPLAMKIKHSPNRQFQKRGLYYVDITQWIEYYHCKLKRVTDKGYAAYPLEYMWYSYTYINMSVHIWPHMTFGNHQTFRHISVSGAPSREYGFVILSSHHCCNSLLAHWISGKYSLLHHLNNGDVPPLYQAAIATCMLSIVIYAYMTLLRWTLVENISD